MKLKTFLKGFTFLKQENAGELPIYYWDGWKERKITNIFELDDRILISTDENIIKPPVGTSMVKDVKKGNFEIIDFDLDK